MTTGRPPSLEELLGAERERPGAPSHAKDEARASLASLLGSAAGLKGGGPTPPASPAPGGGGSVGGAPSAVTGGVGLAKLAIAFALGSAVTAGALTVARPPHESPPPLAPVVAVHEVDASPVTPSPKSDAPETAQGAAIDPSSVPHADGLAPPRATSSAPRHDPVTREEDHGAGGHGLAAERMLLERARSALARGDGEQALAATEEHAHAFPHGQLAEEREVLAIQALVAAGRQNEAANRAGKFRLQYKNSVLLPVVDEALR